MSPPLGMEPGLLREHVEVLEKSEVDDLQGGRTVSWQPVADPWEWARVRPLSAHARFMAQQAGAPAAYEVTLRSRDGLTSAHAVRWDERVLEFRSGPVNVDEHGEFIVFQAAEARL